MLTYFVCLLSLLMNYIDYEVESVVSLIEFHGLDQTGIPFLCKKLQAGGRRTTGSTSAKNYVNIFGDKCDRTLAIKTCPA